MWREAERSNLFLLNVKNSSTRTVVDVITKAVGLDSCLVRKGLPTEDTALKGRYYWSFPTFSEVLSVYTPKQARRFIDGDLSEFWPDIIVGRQNEMGHNGWFPVYKPSDLFIVSLFYGLHHDLKPKLNLIDEELGRKSKNSFAGRVETLKGSIVTLIS